DEGGGPEAIQREAPLEPERTDRRLPPEPKPQRVSQVPEAPRGAGIGLAQEIGLRLVAVLRLGVEGITDVEEDHALDVRGRDDHELELQIQGRQEVSTDPIRTQRPRRIGALRDLDARAERAVAEPANSPVAVDTAGKEPFHDGNAAFFTVVDVPDLQPRLEDQPCSERLFRTDDRKVESAVENVAVIAV